MVRRKERRKKSYGVACLFNVHFFKLSSKDIPSSSYQSVFRSLALIGIKKGTQVIEKSGGKPAWKWRFVVEEHKGESQVDTQKIWSGQLAFLCRFLVLVDGSPLINYWAVIQGPPRATQIRGKCWNPHASWKDERVSVDSYRQIWNPQAWLARRLRASDVRDFCICPLCCSRGCPTRLCGRTDLCLRYLYGFSVGMGTARIGNSLIRPLHWSRKYAYPTNQRGKGF